VRDKEKNKKMREESYFPNELSDPERARKLVLLSKSFNGAGKSAAAIVTRARFFRVRFRSLFTLPIL